MKFTELLLNYLKYFLKNREVFCSFKEFEFQEQLSSSNFAISFQIIHFLLIKDCKFGLLLEARFWTRFDSVSMLRLLDSVAPWPTFFATVKQINR